MDVAILDARNPGSRAPSNPVVQDLQLNIEKVARGPEEFLRLRYDCGDLGKSEYMKRLARLHQLRKRA